MLRRLLKFFIYGTFGFALIIRSTFAANTNLSNQPATLPQQQAEITTLFANNPPVSISLYQQPALTVSKTDRTVQISSQSSPAGLTFSYALNPKKHYEITLEGHNVTGKATLNIGKDEQHEWISAPDGQMQRVITHVNRFAMIIYNDHAFNYQLNRLKVNECTQCLTIDEKKQQVANLLHSIVSSKEFTAFQYYNEPQISSPSSGKLLLTSDNPPSGLQLNFALDPTQKYRLTMAGENILGKVAMRLSKNGTLSWPTEIPSNLKPLLITNTQNFQVLLYGDQKVSYQLNNLSLNGCPKCNVAEKQ